MSLFEAILSRHSVMPKRQGREAPSAETLERAVAAAQAAPRSCEGPAVRFVRIVSREKFADLFEARLKSAGETDPEKLQKARSKAKKGAACIALVGPRQLPGPREEMEARISAGASLMNFLLTLDEEGVDAVTFSAHDFDDPMGLYDPAEEVLLCYVLCARREAPRQEAVRPSRLGIGRF